MGQNLIWQYYYPGKHGALQRGHQICVDAMCAYAAMVGADHQFHDYKPKMTDNPYYEVFAIFSEEYDDYDTILAVDADIIPAIGLTENIFDWSGNWATRDIDHWKQKRATRMPVYDSIGGNGGVYKFTRKERQRMRPYLSEVFKTNQMDRHGQDEYGMHVLLHYAGMIGEPLDVRWNERWVKKNPNAFFHHCQGQGDLMPRLEELKNEGLCNYN